MGLVRWDAGAGDTDFCSDLPVHCPGRRLALLGSQDRRSGPPLRLDLLCQVAMKDVVQKRGCRDLDSKRLNCDQEVERYSRDQHGYPSAHAGQPADPHGPTASLWASQPRGRSCVCSRCEEPAPSGVDHAPLQEAGRLMLPACSLSVLALAISLRAER